MKKIFYILTFTFILTTSVFATTPSNWAVDEINTAIEQNLVPKNLQNNYTENISRKDFCKLCTSVMKAWDENFVVSGGSISFEDTDDSNILACANIGIVNGTGNNKFSPDKPITRQEAARMLYNTLKIATPVINNNHIEENKANFCCFPHVFSDSKKIRSWARDEVNHLYRLGIMLGTSDNSFMPDNYYTKEQAICTFLRLYNAYKNPDKNTLPQADLIIINKDLAHYDENTLCIELTDDVSDVYIPFIVDSNGNHYTKEEKGWLPVGVNYGEIITAAFPGVHNSYIIDRYGNKLLTDVEKGNFYEVRLAGNLASVTLHSNYTTYKIYNLVTGEYITDGHLIPENLYKDIATFVTKNNTYGFINIQTGEIIAKPVYTNTGSFYNDLAIVQKSSNDFAIINTYGNELKTFKLDKVIISEMNGTNAICCTPDTNKYYVYRAYSEKFSDTYDYICFANNELIARNNSLYYILNPDCSIKKDCSNYKTVSYINYGIYKAYKDYGESSLIDIINADGDIILKDVPDNANIDSSGLIVTSKGTNSPVITIYDFNSNILSERTFTDYTALGYSEYNTAESAFTKGTVYIHNLENKNSGKIETLLLTPNGKIIK